MKRSCHGDDFEGSGTKEQVNILETAAILWHGVP
jgi:hypothetical protein